MEKKFTKFQIATIKRTAQNVNPLVVKKDKINAKIAELNSELDTIQKQIDSWESAISAMTGGFTTEDLVSKVVIPDGGKDKNGNPTKITKFVLKYPDTVLPPICGEASDVKLEDIDDTEVADCPFEVSNGVETIDEEDCAETENDAVNESNNENF
jgi:hypothetical protein